MLYYLKETLASQFLVPMLHSANAGNGVFQVNKISLNFFLMVQKLIWSNNEVNFERVLMMWVKSFAQFYFPFIFHFTGVLSSKRFALIYLDIVHTFLVKNGAIYTVFFANCSPCFEKKPFG